MKEHKKYAGHGIHFYKSVKVSGMMVIMCWCSNFWYLEDGFFAIPASFVLDLK